MPNLFLPNPQVCKIQEVISQALNAGESCGGHVLLILLLVLLYLHHFLSLNLHFHLCSHQLQV